MRRRRHAVNLDIAKTHIFTRKRQIIVASLGVTVGMSVFIFMNSLMKGFDRYSVESLFKTVPHLRIYREDKMSHPLSASADSSSLQVLLNPKVTTRSKKITNPEEVVQLLRAQQEVVAVTPDVVANVFYNNGSAQVAGRTSGVNIREENEMFNLEPTMVEGQFLNLESRQNGIVLGDVLASKLNVRMNDYITVTSALGVSKVLQVVGLFHSGISSTDRTKSYVNIPVAQQFHRQGPSYITDIFVNIRNPNVSEKFIPKFSQLTGYDAEDWKTANASALAANRIRRVMALAISSSILLVAGFGIYNIMNMTVMQKMNDIAILKAMGFSGPDVIRIFLLQGLLIGFLGVFIGWFTATGLVRLLANVWVGGDIGYFPIGFEPQFYALGSAFGMFITLLAGLIPARRAAKVDPVAIFRK